MLHNQSSSLISVKGPRLIYQMASTSGTRFVQQSRTIKVQGESCYAFSPHRLKIFIYLVRLSVCHRFGGIYLDTIDWQCCSSGIRVWRILQCVFRANLSYIIALFSLRWKPLILHVIGLILDHGLQRENGSRGHSIWISKHDSVESFPQVTFWIRHTDDHHLHGIIEHHELDWIRHSDG